MSFDQTSLSVRIWGIETYKGKTKSTYWVRWRVSTKRFKEPFSTKALAESFRSRLRTAASNGEAFRLSDGLPVSMVRPEQEMDWYTFARKYADMKWPKAAATYRRTIAEALTAITPVMLSNSVGRPDEKNIRSVLNRWGFNTQARDGEKPEWAEATLRWISRNSLPLAEVMRPEIARKLHDAAVSRVDGKPLARSVARQRRMILNNALSYAVELGLIPENPVKEVKWTAPKPSRAIDVRRVANPVQVRTLLHAVKRQKPSGERLYACYATMYFALARSEEALNLRESNLSLPEPEVDRETGKLVYEWGKIWLEEATPHAGKAWTDSGKARDERGLKHRERGEGRWAPCPPELTAILLWHLKTFGVDDERRLFRGVRGGEVPLITWNRVWQAARGYAFTEEVAATPLAGRPYDLRHAGVSAYLGGGVSPTTVAEWAGHSVEVLLQVYAKCLHGQDRLAQELVQAALGHRRR
ncbi:tyrosine-type recombinase/integrase [Amycolatopsis thermoflava]|uniref:tyrosine-type recombinase/integrase n=1 Tax=Amycolatopsis thermoflava TaxID=84480 RepID=UPI003EB8A6D3